MSPATPHGAPHVLMTTDAVGGVWTYAADLGRELVRSGVRVTLAVIGPEPDPRARAKVQGDGMEIRCLAGELDWTAESEAEVAASAKGLLDLAHEIRPHLIHLNSPALAAFNPFPVPVIGACHSCVATWWSAVKADAPLPSDLAWRARLTARGYTAVDTLLAPSRAFAEATQVAYDLPTAPYVVINGRSTALHLDGRGFEGGDGGALSHQADYARFAKPNRQAQRRDAGLYKVQDEGRNARPTVFTAGRLWDEGKDIGTLDRAAGRLRLVSILAAGALKDPYGNITALHHVQALGPLGEAELNAYLETRPIFVSTSLYEPFGLAVLEAAQAGCPLVLSDIATFRELWDGAAIFFQPGDDAALAAHLDTLAADADQRAALGQAACTRADCYTAAAMADATLENYGHLSPAFPRTEAAA